MALSPPQPTQVIVITQPPVRAAAKPPVIIPGYKAKLSQQLGISLLVVAPLSMAFGIAGLAIQTFRYGHGCDHSNWASYVATGIWCGFWVSMPMLGLYILSIFCLQIFFRFSMVFNIGPYEKRYFKTQHNLHFLRYIPYGYLEIRNILRNSDFAIH